MKCLGRTASLHRCKNDARVLFCRHHRFQPYVACVTALTLVGLCAGLYHDVWKPLFPKKSTQTEIPKNLVAPDDPYSGRLAINIEMVDENTGTAKIFGAGPVDVTSMNVQVLDESFVVLRSLAGSFRNKTDQRAIYEFEPLIIHDGICLNLQAGMKGQKTERRFELRKTEE